MSGSGRVIGAILAGGVSSRMGTEKALLEVDGRPMAHHVAEALRAGGCEFVLLVGASPAVAGALDLPGTTDAIGFDGPLAGVAATVAYADAVEEVDQRLPHRRPVFVHGPCGPGAVGSGRPASGLFDSYLEILAFQRELGADPWEKDPTPVVVAGCDQVGLSAGLVEQLLAALAANRSAGAAAPGTPDGRRHPLPVAYRRLRVAEALDDLAWSGAARADALFGRVEVVDVACSYDDLTDLDTPADLRRWREGGHPTG